MMNTYFEIASATCRFLHRPTVEAWMQEFLGPCGFRQNGSGDRSKKAIIFMMLAHGHSFMHHGSQGENPDDDG